MNLYLLEMILKFLRMIFVAFISLFNITLYAENENIKENSIMNTNKYAVNKIVINENISVKNQTISKNLVNNKTNTNGTTTKNNITTTKSNTSVSKNSTNTSKIVTNTNSTTNKTDSNQTSTIEKISTTLEEYTGSLTGYGPDCAGCSKVGNVACRTREKKSHSLINDGIYYTDKEYGKVRILAAATTKFKCGTIIVVTKPGMEPFTGIVLDTGGSMRKAWENGNVWMDLAYASETMAGSDKLTGKNIKFSVQRWGW